MGQHPTARGTTGTKRRVLTGGGGVPRGRAGEGATRHAVTRTRETRERSPGKRPEPIPARPPGRCLDQGADDEDVRALRAECGGTAPRRARGEAAQALRPEAGFRARRWVVARPHRWMNRCRRVLRRWDQHVRHEVACRHWACAYLTYRQSGRLG